MSSLSKTACSGLTITNPLVLYRALVATRQIDPDPAQHRLAIHLQKLYYRLKDYTPNTNYGSRLKAISLTTENDPPRNSKKPAIAILGHPLRRNPLFAHLFAQKERKDILSLTRVLTNEEEAIHINSPQGLLVHADVGRGKSMLLDLLADSLPNRRKRRWHFNTFMLETLARLESLRQSRVTSDNLETEYSLLCLAKDMIENTPILFLDEFQLPDRASSKILSNLLTAFFQLGGVLIASSNRMPDELMKANGVEFSPPPREGIMRNWLGLGSDNHGRNTASGDGEFVGFLEVLKARCEVWEMEGGRDWRRKESDDTRFKEALDLIEDEKTEEVMSLEKMAIVDLDFGIGTTISDARRPMSPVESDLYTERLQGFHAVAPKKYLLSIDAADTWEAVVRNALPGSTPTPVPWGSTTLSIYGRTVSVPRQYNGVTLWSFDEICGGYFGPADYISMASTFHTFILDQVPTLTLLQKNEARRMITLLDALYEARCKLIVRADAGPDELFFPEESRPKKSTDSGTSKRYDDTDAVYPETFSEIYQDQTSPFRPNAASYDNVLKTGYGPDEDSDFGILPGQGNEIGRQIDFGMTGSLIGEDEIFAYKRARSRLWEMCGSQWHARSELGWWRPLPLENRSWERSPVPKEAAKMPAGTLVETFVRGDVKVGKSIDLDRPAGLQGKELEIKEQDPARVSSRKI